MLTGTFHYWVNPKISVLRCPEKSYALNKLCQSGITILKAGDKLCNFGLGAGKLFIVGFR